MGQGEKSNPNSAWQREQARLAQMTAQAKQLGNKPLIDETFTGGPSSGMSLQRPGGSGEIHLGLTVLDQYALVALRAFIQRGVGFQAAEGNPHDVTLKTEVLAAAAMAVARDCIFERSKVPIAVPREEPAEMDDGKEPTSDGPESGPTEQ